MSSAPAAETRAAAVAGAERSRAGQSESGQLNANVAHSATPNRAKP